MQLPLNLLNLIKSIRAGGVDVTQEVLTPGSSAAPPLLCTKAFIVRL